MPVHDLWVKDEFYNAPIRDELLELAARMLSIANDIWTPLNIRDEAEDMTACLVTAANKVMGYECS